MEQEKEPIKVAVVDDQALFLELLSTVVGKFPEVNLCWTAGDGREAVRQIAQQEPDLMLVDYEMPHMNGLELVRYLDEHHPLINTILLSSYDDEQTIFTLFNAGINSYLLKGENVATIQKAINAVRNGDQYFPGYVFAALRKMHRREERRRKVAEQAPPRLPSPITARETEVLQLLCQSLNNDEVAQRLGIATRTVETHRSNIIEKIGTDSLFGAAMVAIKNGWIDLWAE